MDDAETITERALTRVLGYVDPVAHALATKAAARDETTIAAALKNVLDADSARAVQEAVQNRQGPSDDEESSSDDEQIDAPAWASERDLDEAVAAFDASGGALTEAAWDHACRAADALEELAVYKLDPARQLMLYAKLVEVYGTLSRDADRAAKAAQWCVQQAVSPGCADAYAIDEASPKDAFNQSLIHI